MSWFNLNDSLNNIKGQITSFASDVLTDEAGTIITYVFQLPTCCINSWGFLNQS